MSEFLYQIEIKKDDKKYHAKITNYIKEVKEFKNENIEDLLNEIQIELQFDNETNEKSKELFEDSDTLD